MMQKLLSLGWIISILAVPSWAADLSTELINQGKGATALVVVKQGMGSGFCINSHGLFLTNKHVVSDIGIGGDVTLIINPSQKDQAKLQAKVLAIDDELDLALLAAPVDKQYVALSLAADDVLTETQRIYAFGYPFGSALSFDEKGYPSISINSGEVTSLRKRDGQLEAIQVDASLNPGNSGGPVIDTNGQVVGVVVAGIVGTGVNFVIPISHVNRFLKNNPVVLTDPLIKFDQRYEIAEFRCILVDPRQEQQAQMMELYLSNEMDKERRIEVTHESDGTWLAHAQPVAKPTDDAQKVMVALLLSNGVAKGLVTDQTIKVDGKPLHLSELKQIELGEKPFVETSSGQKIAGTISDLDSIKLTAKEGIHEYKAAEFKSIMIEGPWAGPSRIDYRIVARSKDHVLSTTTGHLNFFLPPTAHTFPKNTPPDEANAQRPTTAVVALAAEPQVLNLSGPIEQMTMGAAGRYMFLRCKGLNKLVVVDLPKARIVKYIDLPDTNVPAVFAAGMDWLFVLTAPNVIQRWNLQTLESDRIIYVADLDLGSQFFLINQLVMGSASAGPLAFKGSVREMVLFDPQTMTKLPMKSLGGGVTLKTVASADGSCFVSWDPTRSLSGVNAMVREGNEYKIYQDSNSIGELCTTFDGSFVLASSGIIYSPQAKRVNVNILGRYLPVPVMQAGFFLGVTMPSATEPRAGACVFSETTMQKVFDLPELPERNFRADDSNSPSHFGVKIQLIPRYNLLVSTDQLADRLFIRKFDFDQALRDAHFDSLYVQSVPNLYAQPGTTYSYPLDVHGADAELQYALAECEPGMQISPQGLLTWPVPPDFFRSTVPVVITITSGKQQITHRFRIHVKYPTDDDLAKLRQDDTVAAIPWTDNFQVRPLTLPGKITNATLAGGGDLLVFHIPDQEKLAFFSFKKQRMVAYAKTFAHNAILAGGKDKLVVVFPEAGLIERWNLRTFERELRVTSPLVDKIEDVAIGFDSDGPLWLKTQYGIKALDLQTMRESDHTWVGDVPRASRHGRILVNPAGNQVYVDFMYITAYPGWFLSFSPPLDNHSGFFADPLYVQADLGGRRYLSAPWPEGKPDNLTPLEYFVPTRDSAYFLDVDYHDRLRGRTSRPVLTICSAFDGRDICPVPLPETVMVTSDEAPYYLPQELRFQYRAKQNLLVVIPLEADQLILEHVDLVKGLQSGVTDYFFIESSSPPSVLRGGTLTYDIVAHARKTPIKYELLSGPAGMTVSPSGRVQWTVPAAFTEQSVKVVVDVQNAQGRSILHAFDVQVGEDQKAKLTEIPEKRTLVLWPGLGTKNEQFVAMLMDHNRPVYRLMGYLKNLPAGQDSLEFELPAIYFDNIRLEWNNKFHGNPLSLSEVALLDAKGRNILAADSAKASLGEVDMLTDGQSKRSDKPKVWTLPPGKTASISWEVKPQP